MLPFAFTIFAGAFLLFAVEPLIGKYILPWFGGGPGVWTACLLFFQTALLAGYAYAHLSASRLTVRRQVLVHLVLLTLAVVLLPVVPGPQWKPIDGTHPVARILLLLGATVGLPFFVLAGTGPLLQRWFSAAWPGRSPYRLYALSNAGSLLALLAYPFYFERAYSRQDQALLWSLGLGLFALGCLWCGGRMWRRAPAIAPEISAASTAAAAPAPRAAVLDRLLWFVLAAVASILLLATTNKLCVDIAVVPFLWILPLALYLLSFIVCFDHPRWYSRGLFSALFAAGALLDVYLLRVHNDASLGLQIAGYSAALFFACMVCHGEIYRLRPAPAQLTSFYLSIAAGGAAGGLFVAVAAPLIFNDYFEFQIGLWLLTYLIGMLAFRARSRALVFGTGAGLLAAALLVPALSIRRLDPEPWAFAYWAQLTELGELHWEVVAFLLAGFLLGTIGRRGWVRDWQPRTGNFLMLYALALGAILLAQIHDDAQLAYATSRDFYGVLKIFEHDRDKPEQHNFRLVHGSTTHGLQFVDFPQCTWPTSYYGPSSGLGLAIAHLELSHPRRIGLVGLGTGTVASYGQSRGSVRIYEIDPQVERIARTRFTYLEHSAARIDVIMGDARLSMERELAHGEPQHFDVLVLDAFTSDAIPVHLLTAEAFATYLQQLEPNGVIAVHISNRYLDLRPVVENLARHFHLYSATISDHPPEKDWWLFPTRWVLVTRNSALLANDEIMDETLPPDLSPDHVGLWTDDHTSLFEILRSPVRRGQ